MPREVALTRSARHPAGRVRGHPAQLRDGQADSAQTARRPEGRSGRSPPDGAGSPKVPGRRAVMRSAPGLLDAHPVPGALSPDRIVPEAKGSHPLRGGVMSGRGWAPTPGSRPFARASPDPGKPLASLLLRRSCSTARYPTSDGSHETRLSV